MVAFIGASALFILLEIDFLALILLIVYVGAIAIFILFVIMMLNYDSCVDRARHSLSESVWPSRSIAS